MLLPKLYPGMCIEGEIQDSIDINHAFFFYAGLKSVIFYKLLYTLELNLDLDAHVTSYVCGPEICVFSLCRHSFQKQGTIIVDTKLLSV